MTAADRTVIDADWTHPESEGGELEGLASKRSLLIADQVQGILEQAGIRRLRQVSYVAEKLNLNGRTARRKLHGETSFTEHELCDLLATINIEYLGLHGVRRTGEHPVTQTEAKKEAPVYECEMELAGELRPCKVWVREGSMKTPGAAGKVLVAENGRYAIRSTQDVVDVERAMLIERIEFMEPYKYEGSGSTLIVLNQDDLEGRLLAQAMEKAGYKAKHVGKLVELTAALVADGPKAVLAPWADWSDWSPEEIASTIRKSSKDALIVFSTPPEDMSNTGLLTAVATHDAEVIPQPATSMFIARLVQMKLRKRAKENETLHAERTQAVMTV